MQLKQLRHLVAVAEQGSFGRAAEAVHLSQPALSRSIDSLEVSLGAVLVDRGYGAARLTAAGEMVAGRAARLLQDAEELQRDVRRLQACEWGELRVGMGAFAAAILGQPAVAHLAAAHPQLRLHLEVGSQPLLIDQLERRQVDVLVMDSRQLEHRAGLHLERLPDVGMAFFVRARHPLRQLPRPTLRDALAYPVAAPHLPDHLTAYFNRRLKAAPRALLTVACNDLSTLRHMALHSDTVILAPDLPGPEAFTASLHRIDFAGLGVMRTHYGFVRSAGRTATPAVQAFERVVRDIAGRKNE